MCIRDRFQALLELGLIGRRQRHDLAAAIDPFLAQLDDLVDAGLPRPRLQLARFVDDNLAQILSLIHI